MTNIEKLLERIENGNTGFAVEYCEQKISAEDISLLAGKLCDVKVEGKIHWLFLRDSTITEEGHFEIAKMLEKNKGLTMVQLQGTHPSIKALAAYAEALKTNICLTTLCLHDNNLGPDAGKALSELLEKNKGLLCLLLGNNNLGSEATAILLAGLEKNTRLESLSLPHNNLGPKTAQDLITFLEKNTTLKELNLGDNNMGPEAGEMLAKALERNTSIEKLIIEGNNFSPKDHSAIIKFTQRNKKYNEIQRAMLKLEALRQKPKEFNEYHSVIKGAIDAFAKKEYASQELAKRLQDRLAKCEISCPLVFSDSATSVGAADKGDSKEKVEATHAMQAMPSCDFPSLPRSDFSSLRQGEVMLKRKRRLERLAALQRADAAEKAEQLAASPAPDEADKSKKHVRFSG